MPLGYNNSLTAKIAASYLGRYLPANHRTARTTVMKKLMTSCITILLLANLVHTNLQSPMSAQEIIDRMSKVYASCRTYSDEGEVRTEYVGVTRLDSMRQPFFTAFVKPGSFRFE